MFVATVSRLVGYTNLILKLSRMTNLRNTTYQDADFNNS